jgi:hypothetical protein
MPGSPAQLLLHRLNRMKLPLHTTSAPIVGSEARRVLRAVKTGRAVTNRRAKAFAEEIVAELRGAASRRRKTPAVKNG